MKVINLYGGPGSGKSTTAAGLFYKMKLQHTKVELVTEYAKDLVYSNRLSDMLDQQEYIFAKQNAKLHRLRDQVDYVITDSPLLLSIVYAQPSWDCYVPFCALVRCTYSTYDNMNIYLQRPEEFQQYGRAHDKDQAEEIDNEVLEMLSNDAHEIITVPVDENVVDSILVGINNGY